MAKSVVAIVGRPNVGKSTFFNRCVGARHAIVDDRPGVTRDRLYHETDWAGHEFVLVDTGGIIPDTNEPMAENVYNQVRLAIDEADVIVFMVDGKEGPTGADEEVANLLRRTKKPVILAVNKVDSPKDENSVPEFFALGLGEPHGLSAMRGTGGVGDLLDLVVGHLPTPARPAPSDEELARLADEVDKGNGKSLEEELEEINSCPLSIAIVGKPNVGKSSILNVLCGTDRMIVSPEPGTTRDAIDTKIKVHGREITLIDTAGIRRKSKVDYGVEAFSVVRSLKAISRADVVVLVVDVTQPVTEQEQKIAAKIEEAGKPVVIALNKWDLEDDKSSSAMNKLVAEVERELRHIGYADIIFTSAVKKTRLLKLIEVCEKAYAESRRRIATALVNEIVRESVALVPPPSAKRGKRLKVYYATQVSTGPPTFVLFVNEQNLLPSNYRAYLERKVREAFGFKGTPIRLVTKPKKKR